MMTKSCVLGLLLVVAGPAGATPPAPASMVSAVARSGKRSPPPPVKPADGTSPRGYVCIHPSRACTTGQPLLPEDLALGRIAWKYFENNYQATTGLVNAADKYESTTMWDTASVIAGTVAARDLGIIDEKKFDDRITAMLATLVQLELFHGEAPNKAYNTRTGKMSNYGNKPSVEGIGYSALDLARLISWMDILAGFFPKHAMAAQAVIRRWTYCRMIQDGQMYGAYVDGAKKAVMAQEGRLGYEQYAGKMFARLGFEQRVAATYKNEYAHAIDIYGVPIAFDIRDPRKLGAFNYVVTESYALDAMEFGLDEENAALVRNVYEVQKRRWQRTGHVTAVSEDNLDRAPYFVYNTIFAAGSPWNAITDTGVDQSRYRTISTKAAFSLATLFPEDPYSAVLMDKVASAYDPERGWYSGIYESGIGYNKAITANTNGIILEALLYKSHGPLHPAYERCNRSLGLEAADEDPAPGRQRCYPPAGSTIGRVAQPTPSRIGAECVNPGAPPVRPLAALHGARRDRDIHVAKSAQGRRAPGRSP
ncbi:MAG TPA: DUF3131 domain-containing protein [Polyangia bacterium]|nr:DUF3131 domain-containing protein [Polyangia bacterium]